MAADRFSHRRKGEVWAVTAYFNPMGYESRLRNYRIFREHLDVPLVAVELAYGERFELDSRDADRLVQIRGGDILWQKERLLNIAIARTPKSCGCIAWIDCDIVFDDPEWVAMAREALTEHKLLQPFRRVHQTDGLHRGFVPLAQCEPRDSLVARMRDGSIPDSVFRTQGASMKLKYSPGHVWAGRRDILLAHGLYDALVMGSGDKAIAAAAFGRFDDAVIAFNMNPRVTRHYLSWAAPFHEAVQGEVGFLDLDIQHLWHGDLNKRKYDSRYREFADFDPYNDIALDVHGAWRWCTRKPEIHERLASFFEGRDEDARPPAPDPR